MTHTVNNGYYEQVSIWRDPDDIKGEIDGIKATLRESNRRMKSLDAARESISEMLDTQEIGEDTSIVSALEILLERAEQTCQECSTLLENLDELREELDESIWWARGGISKA